VDREKNIRALMAGDTKQKWSKNKHGRPALVSGVKGGISGKSLARGEKRGVRTRQGGTISSENKSAGGPMLVNSKKTNRNTLLQGVKKKSEKGIKIREKTTGRGKKDRRERDAIERETEKAWGIRV